MSPTEPLLEIVRPNGKPHPCIQREVIESLSRTTEGQALAIREMASFQGDLGQRFMAVERKIGGPDPLNPLVNIGLIGAVQHLTSNVAELVQEVKSSRSSIHAIEEKEEVTGIQSRDALVLRMHEAERKAEKLEEETRLRAIKIEEEQRVEALATKEYKRQLTIKAVAIVAAVLTSSGGLLWLAKVLETFK